MKKNAKKRKEKKRKEKKRKEKKRRVLLCGGAARWENPSLLSAIAEVTVWSMLNTRGFGAYWWLRNSS